MTQVRDMLQDADADYWTDVELVDYYNSGIKAIAAERLESPRTTTEATLDGTYEYTIDGVLRYITVKDSNGLNRPLYPDDGTGDDDTYGIIILDYDRIYVNTPETGVSLAIKNISLPILAVSTDSVRDTDEDALENFMLSKAYKKESDMENFQKSSYFMNEYKTNLQSILKHSKLGYVDKTEITTGYFY